MSRIKWVFLLLLILGSPRLAGAVDGVIEINQARVLAGGINGSLVDDPAGFPVNITQPGSYRLTGNLTVADGDTTAISITADGVTIDLGGFAIRGPNIVNDNPACSAGGTGDGIWSQHEATTVRNGLVSGMGRDGVSLGPYSRIEGVIAKHNCGYGSIVQEGSLIVNSQAYRNRQSGMRLLFGQSLVKDSVARDNMEHGMRLNPGALVLGCVISMNRQFGISVTDLTAAVGDTVFFGNIAGHADAGRAISCITINSELFCPPPGSS